MWLFTDNGFVSAVRKDGSDNIAVRARDLQSLEELSELAGKEVIENEGTDYRYRVIVPENVWADYVSNKALDIDYSNFKSRVYDSRGKKFAKLLGEVWAVMLGADDKPRAVEDEHDPWFTR